MNDAPVRSYEFGPFRMDMQRYLLLRHDQPIQLSPKAFRTLRALVENRDRVVKKEELINTIWPDSYVEESNLAQNIFVLRRVLGDEKTDHNFIVTIPGTGYRFVAQVKEQRSDQPSATKKYEESTDAGGSSLTISSIAVLPFKSLTNDASDEFLGLGLADSLVASLSSLNQLRVRPTVAVLQYRNAKQDPLVIGRELKVDSLLYGTFQRVGDEIRVSVQLVRVKEGTALWTAKFDEGFTSVFSIQDSISRQVAGALALKLGGEEKHQSSRTYAHNSDAFLHYIRGRYFWNQRTGASLKKGLHYAQLSIAADPTYGPGYVGIADSYNLLAGHGGMAPHETFPKAKAAALRALEIDETLAEAYASLAFTNYRFEWNWVEAEENFRRAIELKPNYPTAHHWYGEYLACLGRFDESVAALKRAKEYDPLSLPVNTDLAQTAYFAGRYDRCVEIADETLDMDPDFVRAHIIRGNALEQMKRYDEAVTALQRAVDLSDQNPFAMSGLGHVQGVMGKKKAATDIVRQLEEKSRQQYVSASDTATVLAGLGDKEGALSLLERAVEARDVWLVWLKVNPRFDSFRREKRFKELLLRMGLVDLAKTNTRSRFSKKF